MEFEIKGLEKETTQSLEKAFNDLSAEVQNEVKEALKKYAGVDALKAISDLLKEKEGKSEVLTKMQEQLDQLDIDLQKQAKKKDDAAIGVTLEKGFEELIKSDDFKAALKDGFKSKSNFEVKADTSDITGTIGRTVSTNKINVAPTEDLAFIPGLRTVTIGSGKAYAMWMEGSYTSNVGYVGEGVAQATGDTGAVAEKTRKMAKVSAKLVLTAEMLEDAPLVASLFRNKMQSEASLWLDDEVYDGDGSDGGSDQHIYGIKGHATAFSAAAAIAAGKVEKANIGDLVDAVLLQARLAKQKGIKKVWMNPTDFFRFKATKDTSGMPLFVPDVNGTYTIRGLAIVETTKVDAGTMTFADPSKIQLWWKRTPEFKFGQMNGTDMVDDKYTAVMFLRNQVVVEGPDKTALIHVSDIDAGIAAINKL